MFWHQREDFLSRLGGMAVFSFCAAYSGARSARAKGPLTDALRTICRLGAVILAWSVLSMFLWVLLFKLGAWHGWFADGWQIFWRFGYFMTWAIPFRAKALGAVVGVLATACALLKLRARNRRLET